MYFNAWYIFCIKVGRCQLMYIYGFHALTFFIVDTCWKYDHLDRSKHTYSFILCHWIGNGLMYCTWKTDEYWVQNRQLSIWHVFDISSCNNLMALIDRSHGIHVRLGSFWCQTFRTDVYNDLVQVWFHECKNSKTSFSNLLKKVQKWLKAKIEGLRRDTVW